MAAASTALEAFDACSRPERTKRLLWLSQFEVDAVPVAGRPEVLALKQEARVCFIHGLYIATLLTALACVEQMLSEELDTKGHHDFAKLIALARDAKVAELSTLAAADKLREFRNAFAHKKRDEGDESRLPVRMRAEGRHPRSLLEDDAQLAITTMYELFKATLKP